MLGKSLTGIKRVVFVAALSVSAAGLGCGGPRATEATTTSRASLTNGDVMGFETPGAWSTTTAGAVLAASSAHSQGALSLSMRPASASGYTPMTSVPLSTLSEVSNTLAWDVMLPAPPAGQTWFGAAQSYVNCPSRGLLNSYVGQIELTGRPIGSWTTLSFTLTNAQAGALLAAGYSDLTFTLVLNVPVPNGGTYFVDNLRFVPAAANACGGKPNGSACIDGNACTKGDRCQNGLCQPGAAVVCVASDQCHVAGACNAATGVCSNPTKPNGAACNDGQACTQNDVCTAGACAGAPVVCAASDQCHAAGTCNAATGACSNPPVADGASCNDGQLCTKGDACVAGACVGTPIVCTASDQCHAAGACNAATGACSNPPAADGTACNDGQLCTKDDACVAGACVGAPIVCTASDQCHAAGACDPASGACSNPPVADGTSCNDGDACTTADACAGGKCGGAPVVCAAADQCHAAGTCDPASGACSNPPAADGTSCNDGDACTQADHCLAGTCAKGDPVVCATTDGCHPGVCDPTSGACSNPMACHLYGTGVVASDATDGLALSPFKLENGTPNNQIGGFGSAIAYTGTGNLFVTAPDRGPGDGATSYTERFYLMELGLAGGQVTPIIRGAAALDKGPGQPRFIGRNSAFDATNSPDQLRLDVEGVRVGPQGTLFVSDEYGPFIYEISPEGHRLRTLPVPDKFLITTPGIDDAELPPANVKGRQANRGMEGLAISPDGRRLYGIMQSPLIQDGALSQSNSRIGTNVRLLELDIATGATRELLYPMDSPAYGQNEILAVNDHQFLVLERDGKAGANAAFKRLFLIDIAGATDVGGIAALPTTGIPDGVMAVKKTPFLDLLDPAFGLGGATFPEKIEGMSFGPDLPDGRHTLVVTTDNDFLVGNDSRIFVFAIDPIALPGLAAAQASFPAVCVDPAPVTCPAAGACGLAGTCNPGDGTCTAPTLPAGTPIAAQTAGDCRQSVCDAAGDVTDAADDTDLPVDGNPCTADRCTGGVPSNPALDAGTPCGGTATTVCDGQGACVDCNLVGICPGAPPTFRVVRLGDGTATLSSAAAAVFVEERRLDGSLVSVIPLPTAAGNGNLPFAMSGSASSEGGMSLSGDGRSLALAGYAAAPGTAGVASTTAAAVNRLVARVDAAGRVDTSTTFGTAAFSGNNVRGAVSADGLGFWGAGAGGAAGGGVWFATLGSRTAVQVTNSPNNLRWLIATGGQLYGSASNGGFFGVLTVGTGLPTTAGQVGVLLPGMPTSAASPFGFVIMDRDASIPGNDTIYVADDRAASAGGGVQKWTFNGATWSLATTFNVTATPIGFRGLAGIATGATVTLFASTADNNQNRLVVFIDDGVATVTGQVVATAAANTVFRGVAPSPHN